MENENKERIILNDEELKEVVGGKESDKAFIEMMKGKCRPYNGRIACDANALCAWINNQCLPNPNRFEYEY